MSLAREFWRAARPQAAACLAHPFVRGIAAGTLDPALYRDFVAQDATFLEAFARAYAYCLASTSTREALYAFRELLEGVFRELELHRAAARELDIDLEQIQAAPATANYTDFLADAIVSGASIGETLAAMTPCMRLYAYLGAELAAETSAGVDLPAPYREWIDTYAGQDFQELAALIEMLLDCYATGSEREWDGYRRALELEQAFFDAAWAGFETASGAALGPAKTEDGATR